MSEKILVVDDDVDSLKLIGLMLKRQGYEVVAATAGQPALQKAFSEKPALIILDVMMPDMDGYEVTRRLRAEPSTQNIPIIMFTAKTLVDDKVKGFEAGVDDYLTKPTHPAELASRVKATLARRPSGAQNADMGSVPIGNISIGFLGAKGGVGTTTLATSVGAILSQDHRTILTDIRPSQGTLGLSLGYTTPQGFANVMRYAPNDINTSLIEQNLVAHNSGMRLLLSSVNPQEKQNQINLDSLSALRMGMNQLAKYALFDLGSGLDRVTVRLLKEMNQIILTIEPNSVTTILAQSILKELQNIGIPTNKVSVVIFNRTQSSLQLPWQEVEQFLNHEVTAIISPAPELAYQATEAGVPLPQFQPSSIVAGQIAKFVEELVKRGG